ncbi:putative spindle and kinetochore-associated protein 1 -like protein [Capsicum annuum]|uniref:Flavin-containing monooxygenase n=1 Tax=Capsicum annuum TaxID=4072 RepID=A0A2G2ZIP7_CAPAN|nr:putative spindle and kinetochore-associated protein 1 -like protein [Capsicum annuum]KAF3675680.1 putative spindle and kinetochore-associated protein 1 -like protein [Capsicum annuum]PHT81804.1 hypothetical protein T459_14819 [Capsicum annuum]
MDQAGLIFAETSDIAKVAKQVHLSTRFSDIQVSKFNTANIWKHSKIDHVDESGEVTFLDGSSIHADVILHCTGYNYDFPFLETNGNGIVSVDHEDRAVRPLYKHVFPPKHSPCFSFVGKMTTEIQMMDGTTSMGANNIATSSRTYAPPTMAPAEKPKNFLALTSSGGNKRCSFTLPLYVYNDSLAKTLPRTYILSGLQDDLYNVYSGTKKSKELWGALERKYKAEDARIKKFLVARFLDFKMIDSKSVVSQVQEL